MRDIIIFQKDSQLAITGVVWKTQIVIKKKYKIGISSSELVRNVS